MTSFVSSFAACVPMPLYEVLCVANPKAPVTNITRLFQRCSAIVLRSGGVVRGVEHLGIRHLAFPMRKHQQRIQVGRYLRLHMQANPLTKAEVEKTIDGNEHVVLFKTFKKELAPKQPAKIDALSAQNLSIVHRPLETQMHIHQLIQQRDSLRAARSNPKAQLPRVDINLLKLYARPPLSTAHPTTPPTVFALQSAKSSDSSSSSSASAASPSSGSSQP